MSEYNEFLINGWMKQTSIIKLLDCLLLLIQLFYEKERILYSECRGIRKSL